MPVEPELRLHDGDPLAMTAAAALEAGDVRALGQLLVENPDLALAPTKTTGAKHGSRTLLHVFADWPGDRPHAREIVALLKQLRRVPPPERVELSGALWGACHGGRLDTAERLVENGADFNWIGWDNLTALDAAERSSASELAAWLRERGARSSSEHA